MPTCPSRQHAAGARCILDRGSALPEATDRSPQPYDPAVAKDGDLDWRRDPRVALEPAPHIRFELAVRHRPHPESG